MLTDFTEDCPYDTYMEALTRTHKRRVDLRVMDLNHGRVGSLVGAHLIDGQITMDVTNREPSRVLTVTLLDRSRQIGWEPDSPSSLPKHLRRMIQVFDVRFIPGYGPVSCPAGVFVVEEMDRDGAELSIVGKSKEVLAMGSFGKAHSWAKGRKITDVIGEILQLAGERASRIHLPTRNAELQKEFNVSRFDQPLAKARHLAHQLDCVLFYNGRGHAIVRPKPTSPTLRVSRASLTSGVRMDRAKVEFHNRWVVQGKKPKGDKPPPTVDLWLPAQNPFSGVALGRNGVPRWYIEKIDRPHIESKDRLREIAERARDRRIRFEAEVSLDCLPFPNVEEWDLIRAKDPLAGAATVQVRQATLPLVEGSMTLGAVQKVSRWRRHGGYHPATQGGL